MTPQTKLTQAIQAAGPHTADEPVEGLEEGAVLTGWVIVSEWLSLDGSHWLTRIDGDAAGESLPPWRRNGMLHDALGTWEAE